MCNVVSQVYWQWTTIDVFDDDLVRASSVQSRSLEYETCVSCKKLKYLCEDVSRPTRKSMDWWRWHSSFILLDFQKRLGVQCFENASLDNNAKLNTNKNLNLHVKVTHENLIRRLASKLFHNLNRILGDHHINFGIYFSIRKSGLEDQHHDPDTWKDIIQIVKIYLWLSICISDNGMFRNQLFDRHMIDQTLKCFHKLECFMS